MKKCFVALNQNDEIRKISSSGGVFYSLAEKVINEGGVIAAPIFDNNFNLRHTLINNKTNLLKALGSKYVQSDLSDIYTKVKECLDHGVKVLFSGTPCQVVGLKRFLNKEYEELICINLICHGVPSSNYWDKYRSYLETEYGSKITSVEFRNKDYGWIDFCIKIGFANGAIYKACHDQDHYFLLFRDNYILKESCYHCVCKGDNGMADITLADAWGTDHFPGRQQDGLSYVICNTEKGCDFFVNDKSFLCEDINIDNIISAQPFYYESTKADKKIFYNAEDTWEDIRGKYRFIDRLDENKLKTNKSIIPWGAGNIFRSFAAELIRRFGIKEVCDSNRELWGKEIRPGVTCIPPEDAVSMEDSIIIIFIESEKTQRIIDDHLKNKGINDYLIYSELLK